MSNVRKLRSMEVVSSVDELERSEGRDVVTLGGISDSFYQRPEEDDRCYFDTRTAAHLLRMEHVLECLMKCGVAHFEFYDEAIDMHRKEYV